MKKSLLHKAVRLHLGSAMPPRRAGELWGGVVWCGLVGGFVVVCGGGVSF